MWRENSSQGCFTSRGTILKSVRDAEPRTANDDGPTTTANDGQGRPTSSRALRGNSCPKTLLQGPQMRAAECQDEPAPSITLSVTR